MGDDLNNIQVSKETEAIVDSLIEKYIELTKRDELD